MLKKFFKLFSVLVCVGVLSAADDDTVVASATITSRFLTAEDIANADLMTAAHKIVAATPGFDHLVDAAKWNTHLTNIQLPRIAPDAIRMMLFFNGAELAGVGAGGMMPLAVNPVYLDIPTSVVGSDGRVTVTAPVALKFVDGQDAIAAQYRSLVVSQGIAPVESYDSSTTPATWKITNAFASTVTIATALGYGSEFVAMHAAFFEACEGKKLATGQKPTLHVCTLANGEGANADFSATSLKVYQGPFNYYPADKVRGQRAMLVGAYSDKPLP